MHMEDPKIKIGFMFTDYFGNEFSASSIVDVHEDYEDELDVIGRQLDAFLKQVGYIREGCYMLMESLSGEELWALQDHLWELRASKKPTESEAITHD